MFLSGSVISINSRPKKATQLRYGRWVFSHRVCSSTPRSPGSQQRCTPSWWIPLPKAGTPPASSPQRKRSESRSGETDKKDGRESGRYVYDKNKSQRSYTFHDVTPTRQSWPFGPETCWPVLIEVYKKEKSRGDLKQKQKVIFLKGNIIEFHK